MYKLYMFPVLAYLVISTFVIGCDSSSDSEQTSSKLYMALGRDYLSRLAGTQGTFYRICSATEMYRLDNDGLYPDSLNNLMVSEDIKRLMKSCFPERASGEWTIPDGWTRKPLKYVYPGRVWSDSFDLYSFGPNGIDDKGENDDITSWELFTRERLSSGSYMYHRNHEALSIITERLLDIYRENGK